MPSKPMSFKEILFTWQTMADNVEAHLEEMPHLRELHAALAALVERGMALQAESDACTAKLREVNQERVLAAAKGRDLRNRLAALLRGSLGLESPRLVEFGVTPRARNPRRRRRAAAEAKDDRSPVN